MKLQSIDPEALLILLRENALAADCDRGQLDAALAYPLELAISGDADVAAIAAAHAIGILGKRPFAVGNMRAAFLAMGLFLYLNGWKLGATPADATRTLYEIVAGYADEKALADWIRRNL
jgi:death-on-curing protein